MSRGQFSDSDRTAVPDAPETFAHVGLGDPEHDPYVVEGAPATPAAGTVAPAEGDSDDANGPDTGPLVPTATEPAA